MSDDIVTRLRELAIGAMYGINIAPFEHYNAAADEIERLRDERLSWLNIAFCTHCLPQHDHYCAEHLQGKR